MRLTLLGTGDARQVPVYNCDCRACERARSNSARRRGPCCALIEHGDQRWLIDSGLTDLCTRFPPGSLQGILQTHYHADHAQGLLHLRWGVGLHLPVYGPADAQGLADLYKHPGILDFSRPFTAFECRQLGELTVTALPLNHSRPTFGYLFEDGERRIAYLTDTLGLPPATRDYLRVWPLDLLVLDCSTPPGERPPCNHNDLTVALAIVEQLTVGHTMLTHIGHELDEWLLEHRGTLPAHVGIARDGCIL